MTADVLEQATASMAIFVDRDGEVMADVWEGRLRDFVPLRDRRVRCRLAQRLRIAMSRPPTTAGLDAALDVIEGAALVDEDECERKRVAESFA